MPRMMIHRLPAYALFALAALLVCEPLGAQTFSNILSFQGRLCATDGSPVPDGVYSVRFAVYDAEMGGNVLWQETTGVTQAGGTFTAILGMVNAFPSNLFADGDRWLGIKVGDDPEMADRFRFTPSPWAIQAANADKVDGFHASQTPTPTWLLPLDANGRFPLAAIPQGPGSGLDADTVDGLQGSRFLLTDGTRSLTGDWDAGSHEIRSSTFESDAATGTAPLTIASTTRCTNLNADLLDGNDSTDYLSSEPPVEIAGSAVDPDAVLTVRNTGNGTGLKASGYKAGGRFEDADGTSWADLAGERIGINAVGTYAGAVFKDRDESGMVTLGVGNHGLQAYADYIAGYFSCEGYSGVARVGYRDYGIYAEGSLMGAWFADADSSNYAYLAFDTYGIMANGSAVGGRFLNDTGTGEAHIASGYRGIEACGSEAGGFFYNLEGTSDAYLGYGTFGVVADGTYAGALFKESDNALCQAYIASNGYGVTGYGTYAGGYFNDKDNVPETYSYVATGAYSIQGNGTKAFVQNHPNDGDKVITYNCIEGDEAATYTRGTARLIDGVARVPLGETFKWVTNPDTGLTAHITPRGDCKGLYVESITTSEMVVREMGGGTSDVRFDYLVCGLRIGFEEISIVQDKNEEAPIPSLQDHEQLYQRQPGLREYNPLERFRRMQAAAGETEPPDMTRSQALRDAVNAFDRGTHPFTGPGAEATR